MPEGGSGTNRPLSELDQCVDCPRLADHLAQLRQVAPTYHARPVGSWGAASPRILLVGLAPGREGAARTGKAFVGDASGQFLFAGLHRNGLSDNPDPGRARLNRTRITNVVKCLPPGNAPTTTEVRNCSGFLRSELTDFWSPGVRQPRAIVALGGVAFAALCRTQGLGRLKFTHGARYTPKPTLGVFACFHPSRLNVNSRRLTPDMLDSVLHSARRFVGL